MVLIADVEWLGDREQLGDLHRLSFCSLENTRLGVM